MVRVAVLVIALTSSIASAQADLRVSEAIRLYDGGEFAQAKDTLVTVIDSPKLTRTQRSRARIYLAAAYYALGDIASAKAQLLQLARSDPDARIDPALFVPELVALHTDAREEVASETATRPTETPLLPEEKKDPEVLATPPPNATMGEPRLVPVSPPAAPRAPGYLTLVPFGVGQFANGDRGKGVAFLTAEAVSFGAAIAALTWFELLKVEGQFLRSGAFHEDDLPLANTLHVAYHAAFYVGVAVAIGGIAEAVISRVGHSQPQASWSFTGQSLTVRF